MGVGGLIDGVAHDMRDDDGIDLHDGVCHRLLRGIDLDRWTQEEAEGKANETGSRNGNVPSGTVARLPRTDGELAVLFVTETAGSGNDFLIADIVLVLRILCHSVAIFDG